MLLAFLVGVLLKVYDDFVDDERILTNEYVIACLQTLKSACVALLLASDLWICALFGVFNAVCAWSDWSRYSGAHDVSYWTLIPICLALSWSHRPALGPLDAGIVAGFVGLALFEPIAFPEETSLLKWGSRFWGAWTLLTAAAVLRRVGSSMRAALVLFGGYSLASSLGQMLKQTGRIRAWTPAPV